MLLFTPEVKQYRDWFELTHQLHVSDGWASWQRIALPAAGGLEEQPAKLMEALALIAREENALLRAARKRAATNNTNG